MRYGRLTAEQAARCDHPALASRRGCFPSRCHGGPIVVPPHARTEQSKHPILEAALDFSVDLAESDGGVVVAVQGELDALTGPMLRARLEDALDGRRAPSVVIDLEALSFIDSSGLSVLVQAHRWLESRQATLTLTHPSPQTRKVLEITGLDRVFAVTG